MNRFIEFLIVWLLLAIVAFTINPHPNIGAGIFASGISAVIVLGIMLAIIRITFATKTIHFVYWLLRTLHLRPKAKATITQEGNTFHVNIDKLDPGEEIDVKGLIGPMKNKQGKTLN